MLLLIFALALILLIEVPGLVKKKMWRELAVFMGIFVIGAVYSIGQVMRLNLPNPIDLLETVFGPVAKVLETLLMPKGQQ